MILVVLSLVLLMMMVNMEWVLVPPTFPPQKLIVGLLVVIFYHLGVVIIHT